MKRRIGQRNTADLPKLSVTLPPLSAGVPVCDTREFIQSGTISLEHPNAVLVMVLVSNSYKHWRPQIAAKEGDKLLCSRYVKHIFLEMSWSQLHLAVQLDSLPSPIVLKCWIIFSNLVCAQSSVHKSGTSTAIVSLVKLTPDPGNVYKLISLELQVYKRPKITASPSEKLYLKGYFYLIKIYLFL